MIINLHQLKKLPVITKSGIKLGKISEINFLVETQTVYQYIVRSSFLGGRIFLIQTNQVLEISDKIIVDDAVVAEKSVVADVSNKFIHNKILGGVATSEINGGKVV
ncbi:MAG: PRC-barrel domain-containing protein [Candidatus Magasanikbacteria bacterium]|jgi:sporulation protein YlmC with PRC-barrel domain